MATVIGKTSSRIDELLSDLVLDTYVESGRILVKKRSGLIADVGPALPTHTHDDRYFTETESDSRFLQKILSTGSGTTATKRAWGLAQYSEASGSLTGDIVIQTTQPFLNCMQTLQIKGFNYTGDENIIDLEVAFYAFSDTITFVNHGAVNKGNVQFSNVRLMRRISDGMIAIALTPSIGVWHYPKIVVDGLFGHTVPSDAQLQGWTVSRQTSLAAYDKITTVNIISLENRGVPLVQTPTGGTVGASSHLPNDAIARTTHLALSVATVPATAVTCMISMSLNAHCDFNAQTHWDPQISFNNGSTSWTSLMGPTGVYRAVHNNGHPGTNLGFHVSTMFDVRSFRGALVALAVNGHNDVGSGSWTYVSYLLYSIQFLY
jgi:hypothetical protein